VPTHGRQQAHNIYLSRSDQVYSIQHYVMTCNRSVVFSGLPDCHNMTEILLKVALNIITLTLILTSHLFCDHISYIKGKYKKNKYWTINKFIAFHMKFMYRKLTNQNKWPLMNHKLSWIFNKTREAPLFFFFLNIIFSMMIFRMCFLTQEMDLTR